ncbi:F-box protein [Quillaja saponaria]|uniref:F-box protein n=1 Tax=Quillaja saponaria TaxID=32244 RepID=A0AAD7PQ57_QUISA|nr:F-box protein [Quillaja saponaria]
MTTIQAVAFSSFTYSASSKKFKSSLDVSKLETDHLSVPRLLVDELNRRNGLKTLRTTSRNIELCPMVGNHTRKGEELTDWKAVQELYAIMEIVADRVEMHKNIGIQRDNWNRLLLNSVNGMTVTAATMAGLAVMSGAGASLLPLKLSFSFLYMAATGILIVMNKIQPSQLAEEQRNAARLFKQLHEDIKITLALENPKSDNVKDLNTQHEKIRGDAERNGWNDKLEQKMKEITEVLKRKDTAEYVRLGNLVLKVSKALSICGPLFTGLAAVGSAFMGLPSCGSLPELFGVMFGTLATVVNTMEHGGQVGMVFEMYRSCAGSFRLMEDTIESTLKEKDVNKREDGELMEVKLALQLGRSLSELRDLGDNSSLTSRPIKTNTEFASKLL